MITHTQPQWFNNLDDNLCLLCGKTGMVFVNQLRDDETRCAAECNHCGHVQITPLPTPEEDEQYYYKEDLMLKNVFNSIENLRTEEQLMYRYEPFVHEQAVNLAKYLPNDKSLKFLEIGTGFGWLVQFMREDGYQIDGIEISDVKRELCKKRCGIDIFGWNFLQDIPEAIEKQNYYDVLCLMHTLEHISNPKAFINRAKLLLKKAGMICIEVHNLNDWYREHQKEYNNWSFMRTHINYFKPDVLTQTLTECGFINIIIYGHQAHSIENALHWWNNKGPCLERHQLHLPEPLER